MTNDMTRGNPVRLILAFMIPTYLGNIFQQFYNLVDSVIAGRYVGVHALAAIGSTTSLIFLVTGWMQGITSGFAIMVAQCFGAKDYKQMRHYVAMSVYLCAAFVVVMTAGLVAFNVPILHLMNTPDEIIHQTAAYMGIIYAGLCVTAAYNAFAAVLRALNRWKDYPLSVYALCELGAQIGSDVPFCVLCGTALAEGRGERLTKLPDTPEMFTVICKPDVCFSTPALYAKLDDVALAKRPDTRAMRAALEKGDLEAIGAGLCNVFEQVAIPDHLELNYIKSIMMSYGAYGAQMTGSGSAVYGLFDSFEYAAVACTMLKDNYPQVFIAKTV